jgi:hypothetical protein
MGIPKDSKAGRKRFTDELKRRQWSRQELESRRKGDRDKVKIARRLRGETTMTLSWIAQRLAMGAAGYAAQCLREASKGRKHAILRD